MVMQIILVNLLIAAMSQTYSNEQARASVESKSTRVQRVVDYVTYFHPVRTRRGGPGAHHLLQPDRALLPRRSRRPSTSPGSPYSYYAGLRAAHCARAALTRATMAAATRPVTWPRCT